MIMTMTMTMTMPMVLIMARGFFRGREPGGWNLSVLAEPNLWREGRKTRLRLDRNPTERQSSQKRGRGQTDRQARQADRR